MAQFPTGSEAQDLAEDETPSGVTYSSPDGRAERDQLEADRRQLCQQSNVRLERAVIQLERSITQRAQKPVTVSRPSRTTSARARASHARVRSSRGPPSDDDGESHGEASRAFAVLYGQLAGAEQHALFVALPEDSQAAFWADLGRKANARNERLRVAS